MTYGPHPASELSSGGSGAQLPARAGVGLKHAHYAAAAAGGHGLGFFEVHAENYMSAGGPAHHWLEKIRRDHALSIHGVALSIGDSEPLDRDHLARLRELLRRYEPQSFSEHLAWSSHGGNYFGDLLPLPFNDETLVRVAAHVEETQDFLQRRILIENPSTYVEFASSSLEEIDFLTELVARTGCGLLLDVNNVHVTCTNHNRDARAYIDSFPVEAVGEIHLAGFARDADADGAPLLIDAHGSPVDGDVWELYVRALERCGPVATLIERDNDVPAFDALVAEAAIAGDLLAQSAAPQQARVA